MPIQKGIADMPTATLRVAREIRSDGFMALPFGGPGHRALGEVDCGDGMNPSVRRLWRRGVGPSSRAESRVLR